MKEVYAVFKQWQNLDVEERKIFEGMLVGAGWTISELDEPQATPVPVKRGGRPKGSRNRVKTGVVDAVATGVV
jgi:hypothetical protein